MEKVFVKLNPQLEAKGRGFVDPNNGRTISKGKYKNGGIELDETPFVKDLIHNGDLVLAKPEKTAKAAAN